MKKRIVSLFLLLTIVVTSFVGFVGCGKEEEAPVAETETIEVDIDTSIPNITEMSKAEILSLSAEEIKESVENYLPNYKAIYKIDESHQMTNTDWENLAAIICIQLYGSATIESETDSSADEGVTEEADIYSAPTYQDIEPMTLSDFAVYMNTAIDKQYGENYRGENNIDYTTMSEEDLQKEKDDLLKRLQE